MKSLDTWSFFREIWQPIQKAHLCWAFKITQSEQKSDNMWKKKLHIAICGLEIWPTYFSWILI